MEKLYQRLEGLKKGRHGVAEEWGVEAAWSFVSAGNRVHGPIYAYLRTHIERVGMFRCVESELFRVRFAAGCYRITHEPST